MSVYFDTKKKRWRFSFNRVIRGLRTRSTKLLPQGWSRARAEAYDRTEGGRLYAETTGIEQPALSVGGAVALYLDHRLPQLRDRKNIAHELAHLFTYIETAPLSTVGDVARQYAKDEADKLAPATVKNRLSYLKAAVRYAYRRHRYGDRNFADQIELPTVNNARQVYQRVDQVRALLAAIEDEEARAVYTLAFWTGLRWIKEVLPRRPEDVERKGREVWLTAGRTKNGTPRMKFVHSEARWALKLLPFERHWRTYYKEFEAARKALGMEHIHAHDLRHSLASDILSRGLTLSDVGAALSHESPASSARYAHLYPERLRNVLAGVGGKKKKAGRKRAHRRKRPKAKKVA